MEQDTAARSTAGQYESAFGTPPAVVNGIPTLTDENPPPPGVDREAVETLLAECRRQPLRAAVTATFGVEPGAGAARTAIFDDAADAWRIPIADRLGGRCLDVNTGFGTRALLLGELCETVYGTDPSLDALRVLNARDEYPESTVVPIHTTASELPLPAEPVDTITADLVGPNRPADLRETVSQFRQRLKSGGTVAMVLDGWPRVTGVAPAVGVGEQTQSVREAIQPAMLNAVLTASERGYRRLLADCGFADIELYGLLPGPVDPSFIFDVNDPAAPQWLLGGQLSSHDRTAAAVSTIGTVVERTGLLSQCYPSYLVVGTKQEPQQSNTAQTSSKRSQPWWADDTQTGETAKRNQGWLLTRGSARSVILSLEADTLTEITKVPHRRAHRQFHRDEYEVLEALRTSNEPSVRTALPEGRLSESRFGPIYREQPVSGTPISAEISTDPDQFASVINRGLEWISALQNAHKGPHETLDPADVAEQLRVPELDLRPPTVEKPVEVFTTVVHGDYHPRNVFVENGAVSAVIDWELGAIEGNPIVDPAFFIVQVASIAFGGMRRGMDAIFDGETEHSQIVQSAIAAYCDRVGLPIETFGIYVPMVWIRRLELCHRRGATMSYTAKATRRASHVRYCWAHQPVFVEQ